MLEHTSDCTDGRGRTYLKNTLDQISDMIDLEYFKSMLEQLDMNHPIATDKEKELDILAQSVNSVRLKNNPFFLNTEVLKTMYERIIK